MAEKKKGAWYLKGQEGTKRSGQEDEAAKQRREQKGPRRFWLANDTSTKVTFLDTPQFFLYEHQLKIGGNWRNWFTCLKDIDTCPICESGEHPSYVVVATVINHRKWTDKENKVHQNEKQLIVFKGRARQRIMKQIERRDGDLKYCVYELARGTQNTEASTGEDFEFLNKRLTKKQLLSLAPAGSDETWAEPLDYAEILAPKTPKELRAVVGGEEPVGAGEDGDGLPPFDPDDDDPKDKDKDKEKEGKKRTTGKKKAPDDDDNGGEAGVKSAKDMSIDDLL